MVVSLYGSTSTNNMQAVQCHAYMYIDMNVTKQQSELYSKLIDQLFLIHTGALASCRAAIAPLS